MRVEHAQVDDAAATLLLHRAVLAEERYFVTEPGEFRVKLQERAREIEVLGAADNSCFLVAREGRSVLGYLAITGGGLARTAHVGKLVMMVEQRWRGQGVGRALMRFAVDWADANPHVDKLSLAVFADNEPAVALYRAFGFVEEGSRLREYRMDDGSYRDDLLLYRWCGEAGTTEPSKDSRQNHP